MEILKVENLKINYDGKEILDNVSFSINVGEYVAIIGENGAGKSSIIKAILGLLNYKGNIQFINFSQKDLGYLPQQTEIQREFPATVMEIVLSGFIAKLGFRPFYNKTEKLKATEVMQKLNILQYKNACYKELSGGQQQKVLLARALCACSGMLVLDEPTTALDAKTSNELYTLLKELNEKQNVTILTISHDMENVVKTAKRIIYIKGKKIECDYSSNQFSESKYYTEMCRSEG